MTLFESPAVSDERDNNQEKISSLIDKYLAADSEAEGASALFELNQAAKKSAAIFDVIAGKKGELRAVLEEMEGNPDFIHGMDTETYSKDLAHIRAQIQKLEDLETKLG